jgi:hypothetical protein
MSLEIQLDAVLQEIRKNNTIPLSTFEDGTVTYIIYGTETFGSSTGYPVLRVTAPTSSHNYMDKGFLLESSRVAGSNGSAADVNIKTDFTNTLLLLQDAAVSYA